MEQMILDAKAQRASDIHLVCGLPPKFRCSGRLMSQPMAPLSHEACEDYARKLAGPEAYHRIGEKGELDLARTIAGVRVRINLYRQQGHISAAIRLLSDEIPQLQSLGLPPMAETLVDLPRGIILVTGETGSGKSTTLAAMLETINQRREEHILTLEDPIEYIYTPKQSVINQREVGRDTESYGDGLRAALREDPDVILIGEMRDLVTIETALTAAETGHLVFATLHTSSAADTIDRIVDVFPQGRHQQIRMQLSMTLRAVISQQLLPKIGGGRALACELMMVNAAIRNLIREGKTPQIASVLATSAKEGSVTMDNAILRLYQSQIIGPEVAISAAQDAEYVKKGLF